jgi:nitroreductase
LKTPPASVEHGSRSSGEEVLRVIRNRHVVWRYQPGVVEESTLRVLAEAAARAPSADARGAVKVVMVVNLDQVRALSALSPGILGEPAACLVLCVDWHSLGSRASGHFLKTASFDVGAAAENVLLLAEALELGAVPVMSFHGGGVSTLLDLPPSWTPEAIMTLGHRRTKPFHPREDVLDGRLFRQGQYE